MPNEQTSKIGVILFMVISIIVGLALYSGVYSNVSKNINPTTVTNETLSFTIQTNTSTTKYGNIVSVTYFGNKTRDSTANLNTLINWTSPGVIRIQNDETPTIGSNTSYNISYIYNPPEYVNDNISRTFISLLNLFFVLAILATAIFGLYRTGILDVFNR